MDYLTEDIGLNTKEINFVIEYCKDFNESRAAKASNLKHPKSLLEQPNIEAAINHVIQTRLKHADIDAVWLLGEAVDNHYLARQQGNIAASTAALTLIAKHTLVDALAADKVKVDPITINIDQDFAKL